MKNRKKSRENAFFLLFEWSFKQEDSIDEIISLAKETRDISIDDYLDKLVHNVVQNSTDINEVIGKFSAKWKINRISRVTLAALRLAIGEICYHEDIPNGATINEAVELVKEFGTEDEAAYLNGVLGGFVRSKEEV